ncbi:CotH kinase family protein [Spirosoma areae]
MKKFVLLLSGMLSICLTVRSQQVYINEFMASNATTIADGTGAYEDWIEIYNPNSFSVSIGGYYVTDDLNNPTKYQLPTGSTQTTLAANGFLILWASDFVSRGPTHLPFKLAADGEQIGIYRPISNTFVVVDSLSFGAQRTDISRGRQPNGAATWLFFQKSANNTSPGTSNNGKTGYTEFLMAPVFSQAGGFYTSDVNLSLTSPDSTVTIYYTLDGSDPDPTKPNSVTFAYKNSYPERPSDPYGPFLTGSYQTFPYSTSIAISDRTSSPNKESVKSGSAETPPTYFPTTPVFKGTVVRAVAYKPNAIASDIVTQTYFVTPATARFSMPVVSIALTEKHFFDYNTGIYTPGLGFDTWRATYPTETATICTEGNYSKRDDAWERSGNVEFFVNNSPVINQLVELRINGGCSRAFPRKSLRLYGNTDFKYPFFSNRPASQFYNRLLLRNGGNDWTYSLIIDAYMQTMVRHLRFDTQANRPSVVFVNGEYWGVHALYERYDRFYINRNYTVDPDSVDMAEIAYATGPFEATEGDLVRFDALATYFATTNPVNYSYVNTQIDVDNFADYQIAEIYSANTDWPDNNVQLWRKRTSQYVPNAPIGHDGRWRWMMKDMDFGLSFAQSFTHNTVNLATETNNYTLVFRRLLDIPAFKSYFINRYADLLNTTFNPTRTVDLLTAFKTEYDPAMPEHFDRWKSGNTYSGWQTNLNTIQTFAEQRPAYARDHIRTKFGLTANRSLTVNVSNQAQGYVKVNTIDILPSTVGVAATPYPWTGIYFQGNPITLVAKAQPGYMFLYWKEANTIIATDTALTFNPTANRSLLAVFDLDTRFDARPNAFNLLACAYRFDSWVPTSLSATYPSNMHFVSMDAVDPPLTASIADTVTGGYNFSSRTRITGLGAQGISFINTGNANPGYIGGQLGGALLALRTTGLTQASIQWTGGTVTPNARQYAIRLRYRLGDSGLFQDLLDGANNPVEYVRNATAGHSQVIGPVALPANLLNKPYVQLLWQYYWTSVGTSGARDELRLDDIIISRGSCESVASGSWSASSTWSCGRVPTLCDAVRINDGHIVTLSIPNAVAKQVEFGSNAKLQHTTSTAALFLQQN